MRCGSVIPFLCLAAGFCGAEELWSLKPLAHPTKHNSIDAFIREAWQKNGITGSPPADARTLVRRATFDLTGLPPMEEDYGTMKPGDGERTDQAPLSTASYSRLIDKLLASPHYGEQWARHWLDVARYSDTKGYVYAREEKRWVHASAYRDWVVRSLNDDMPYDRFLRLQIAADQLVPPGSPDLAAMGFLTIGRRFLGVTHDIIDDRIDVVMRGTQALTVACARCHDHKYDPISTRDYYSLYGVFQSCAEALVPTSRAIEPSELAARQKTQRETMAKRREEQMARTRARVREHLEAQLELDKYPEEVFGQLLDDKDLNPFIVRRWQSYLAKDKQRPDPIFADWHALSATGSTTELRAAAKRYSELLASIDLRWQAHLKNHPAAIALPDAKDEALRRVLHGIESPCFVPDEHIANNEMYFPSNVVVELWKLQGEVDRWLLQTPDAPAFATVLQDRPLPASARVFLRGNPLTKGDEVPRQFLPALALGEVKPFTRGSGRLELANAIADPRNPLTARVMVNRVWMHHFGRGLVTTPSDFGKRADPPSHPELLDWLAQRFIDSGWSLKALHRTIMLSQTYQQASREEEAGSKESGLLSAPSSVPHSRVADPDNRLIARMNAHRLSFEEARDAWLQAAGKLNLRVGGKPVPLFGQENRRTVYALVDRENVPSVLRTFDFANPDLSIPQRSETTVPQQALFGMNHPFVVQQAKALMNRPEVSRTPDPAARIRQIYARLFQRAPSDAELTSALDFVQSTLPAPLAETASPKAWQYGYGEWDEATGKVKTFTPLPHFTGSAWQGDDAWPNTKLGWAQLTAVGGHPGNDRQHAVVRRWIAPTDGNYAVQSKLIHEPEVSDGIRAFVSHSREGKLRSVKLLGSSADVSFDSLACKAGDTLDFIVDVGDALNSDQFLWSPIISTAATTGSGGDFAAARWDAKKDFASTPRTLLTGWEQFVQVLMLSNEFLFVD